MTLYIIGPLTIPYQVIVQADMYFYVYGLGDDRLAILLEDQNRIVLLNQGDKSHQEVYRFTERGEIWFKC